MTKFIFIIYFMAFSFFGISQENFYVVDFKEAMTDLNISESTTLLIFKKNIDGYILTTGEAMGLPKKSDNHIIIINNLKEITFIQLEDENGNSKKIIAGSGDTVKSEVKWVRLVYYNKEGKNVGEQNFNTIF